MTSDERIECRTEMLTKILDVLDGKEYKTSCVVLCFALASILHHFKIKKNEVNDFLVNFKLGTLAAINEIETAEAEKEATESTVH
jgi:hypothetical protein